VPGVFVSYAREDMEFVTRLHAALAGAGRDPAWDQDHSVVPFGANYESEIAAAIAASDKFVFVLTPASLASRPCGWEIERAQESGKQIIVLLRIPVPDDAVMPDAIAKPNWIFLTDDSQPGFDQGFGQLIDALDTDLAWAHAHARLQTRAQEWSASHADKSRLLRGADLREAEEWLAGEAAHPLNPPTMVQRQYLTASRKTANRLARIVRGALAGGMAIALVLAALAFVQRDHAVADKDQAVFNQTSAEAAQLTETDTSLAANLNAAAYDMKATPTIRSRLIEAENTPLATPLHTGSVAVKAVAFSPSGQLLATASYLGIVQVWRVTDPDLPRRLAVIRTDFGATVHGLAFSPDGQLLAAAAGSGDIGLLTVWSVANPHQPRLQQKVMSSAVNSFYSLAFSPDGRFLVAGDGNGAGIVYTLGQNPMLEASGNLQVTPNPGTPVVSIAFSPTTETLALGSEGSAATLELRATAGPAPSRGASGDSGNKREHQLDRIQRRRDGPRRR
jgi:TIR domain/WD domain, G-beta repeat